jgi:hypothetical protein
MYEQSSESAHACVVKYIQARLIRVWAPLASPCYLNCLCLATCPTGRSPCPYLTSRSSIKACAHYF